MTWLILALISSFFLGIYDVFKKMSVNDNAVLPVLFLATLSGSLVFTPFILISAINPVYASEFWWYIAPASALEHILYFCKALIIATSWILAYFAMKHLPITVITPIRASSPIWTLLGAIILFGEVLGLWQWIGLVITLAAYYIFSLAGKKEGIHFARNKWVLFIILATLIGAGSSLFDKYLLLHYDRLIMQSWFALYLVVILFMVTLIFWWPRRKTTTPFRWHYAIPLIGLTLISADFIYFYALSLEGSMISLISALRRGSVITSFFIGAAVFKGEKNLKTKTVALFLILLGIAMIMLGS